MKSTFRYGWAPGTLLGLLTSIALAAPQAPTPSAAPAGTSPATPPAMSPAPPAAPPPLSNAEASYLFGLTLGEQLKALGLAPSMQRDEIERGIQEGLTGKKSSQDDRRRVQEYVRASMAAQSEHNKEAAADFLAKNAKEKGVKTTASGLQYRVIKAGDAKAASPAPTDQVTVNYRGHFIDGSEFDSSYARGKPAEISLNGVIKGWQEGLALMKPGATYELFVPPELGYGPGGRPGIPGNSLLIFEVELLSVKPSLSSSTPPAQPGKPVTQSAPPKTSTPATAEPAAKSITQP